MENTEPVVAGSIDEAGLVYSADSEAGITRRRRGKGWSYRDPQGRTIADGATLRRVRALAVPPAWTEVWICPRSNGHIQATGRDARGRKQYIYHQDFRALRDAAKYAHMLDFARRLPRIRGAVDAHMRLAGLPREKVLATVVYLLEKTMIRVGNAEYARANRSFGLTTLGRRHVRIDGGELRFRFRGKSGRQWNLRLQDRNVARIVRQCQDLPGQHLFEYEDGERQIRAVTSEDVNLYLREIAGIDATAKDFRTWAGTMMAARILAQAEPCESTAAATRAVRDAVTAVASALGNTPAVCRKCYIHPAVIDAWMDQSLTPLRGARQHDVPTGREPQRKPGLSTLERSVLRLLRR
ncbi:DNA topoisomerase IB [Novosphingobium sp. EMRT-2]|nr:DNA topoisomerase IB [Novosphingobium sp. EMRT-2]